MFEYQFSRALTPTEALMVERALVSLGSRLVFTPTAEVIGCFAKPGDLFRWLESSGIRGLSARRMPDRQMNPATLPAEIQRGEAL
jgi:hypothetical protein